jgi:hypothetical protein
MAERNAAVPLAARTEFRVRINLGDVIVAKHEAAPKKPDRVYPLVKNEQYDRVYDWEDRAR